MPCRKSTACQSIGADSAHTPVEPPVICWASISAPRFHREKKQALQSIEGKGAKAGRLPASNLQLCLRALRDSPSYNLHPPKALSNTNSGYSCTPHSNLARLGAAVLGISVANDVGWLADRQCSPNKGGRAHWLHGQRHRSARDVTDSFQDSIGRAAGVAAAGLHAAPPAACHKYKLAVLQTPDETGRICRFCLWLAAVSNR